jgi:hypothetical protein
MRESHPSASSLKELIRRSSEMNRGHGFAEPAKAVGQMQYVAGKLGVDALELQRIRDMIKDYGKKIGVYEAKAHREMKKHMKANTRRRAPENAARVAAQKRNMANIASLKRRNAAKRVNTKKVVPEREDSPPFEFDSKSDTPPVEPVTAMPKGKFWSKPVLENPPI